ncbi:MAG: hypothetical protein KDD44_05500, partial [Bdellovibrionales bacterium]|nr:hypothetical protein [Bdellovibrionales bacterium]
GENPSCLVSGHILYTSTDHGARDLKLPSIELNRSQPWELAGFVTKDSSGNLGFREATAAERRDERRQIPVRLKRFAAWEKEQRAKQQAHH